MSCLWIALRLPCLPLEALSLPDGSFRAVAERRGPRSRIVCADDAAVAAGVAPGMDAGASRTRVPHLHLFARRPAAESQALAGLAAAAYRCSSRVTLQHAAPVVDVHTVWLEVAGSLRLFGGLETLLGELGSRVRALGYRHRLGAAPTPEAAAIVADAGLSSIRDPAQLADRLAAIALRRLPLPAETLDALAGCGLRTLGEILAIAPSELAPRFGAPCTDWLRRLAGQAPDARRFYRPPSRYRRRLRFEADVDNQEALGFPLRRLLAEFGEYLAARATGVRAFTVDLEHARHPATSLTLCLSAARRDAAGLLALSREHLSRTALPAPVTAVALYAERFCTPPNPQLDLFESGASGGEEWPALLDRLRARLGTGAVYSPGLVDDARPEKAWCECAPGEGGGGRPAPLRPLWLLPVPRPLAGVPDCGSGAERVEGGWWDGGDVMRDYHHARGPGGARLWVYRDRKTGRFYLHGLWA